jgi:hypothetical protein
VNTPLERDPRWRAGLALLRRGEWFEAHELLEAPWRELPAGPVREAVQGTIQAAVALEHLRRGNPVGAEKVWARARARWASLDAWPLAPELAAWAAELVEFMQRLDLPTRADAARAGRPPPPAPAEETWPRPRQVA